MAYRLTLAANLSAEVARVERRELELAFCQLEAPDAHSIHEARKHLKKARALLEAIRPAIPHADYLARKEALRRMGRSLAGVRDQDARLEALELAWRSLARRAADTLPPGGRAEVRDKLTPSGASDPSVNVARDLLSARLSELEQNQPRLSRRDLLRGVADTYGRGRKRSRVFELGASAEELHDLRKQVKHHQHHLSLLERAWPELIAPWRDQVRDLGETLGQHHDTVLLEPALTDLPIESEEGRIVIQATLLHLPAQREELEADASRLAARLYVEPRAAFAERLAGYVALAREG